MGALQGKIAIVTGAASGVGKATSIRFAREGATVVATDINEAGLATTIDVLTKEGNKAVAFTLDVSNQDNILACFAFIGERFGKLDVLVNNAGMSSAAGMDPSVDRWEDGIAATLSSVYWMSKQAVLMMKGRGGGTIVNIASSAGNFLGNPVAWYCGAKAGVMGVTRSFASTYGKDGIRTNTVAPGAIDTPRVRDILDRLPGQEEIHNARSPLGRMASAEEIAACALFLASDESAAVNGTHILADGGYSLVG